MTPSQPSTAAQRMLLGKLRAQKFGGKEDARWQAFIGAFGVESIAQLTFGQAKDAIGALTGTRLPQRQAHYYGDEEGKSGLTTQKQANEIARLEALLGWFGDDRRLASMIRRLTKDKFRGHGFGGEPLGTMVAHLTKREACSLIFVLKNMTQRNLK
jgi:hypothetical protein